MTVDEAAREYAERLPNDTPLASFAAGAAWAFAEAASMLGPLGHNEWCGQTCDENCPQVLAAKFRAAVALTPPTAVPASTPPATGSRPAPDPGPAGGPSARAARGG